MTVDRMLVDRHGDDTPEAAARHETDPAFLFPDGNVRVDEQAGDVPGWRVVRVYRDTKLLREYAAQPMSDKSWAIHAATVYC